MQHVLTALHRGEVQPMVHKSNKSELATLVRDSYYNKMTMPNLQGIKPLQLLLEIAIEKLTRDYMEMLISKYQQYIELNGWRRGV